MFLTHKYNLHFYRFKHSATPVVESPESPDSSPSAAGYPSHPGDLHCLLPPPEEPVAVPPKSILKLPADYDPQAFIKPATPPPSPPSPAAAPFHNPVNAVVTERPVNEKALVAVTAEEPPAAKRVSKFKSMRSQK